MSCKRHSLSHTFITSRLELIATLRVLSYSLEFFLSAFLQNLNTFHVTQSTSIIIPYISDFFILLSELH